MTTGQTFALTVMCLSLCACGVREETPEETPRELAGGAELSQAVASTSHLMWVGAHPDDEIPSSPLLADFCRRPGKKCTVVALTRGERGQCKLAGGCHPDLVTVRTAEHETMGQYLGATVFLGDLGDGTAKTKDGVLSAWAARAGSSEQLVRALQEQIERLRPDALLTFDPRHGTTCHPDHRATGELALLAAQAAGLPKSALLLVESAVAGVGGSTAPGFHQAVASDSRVQTISTAPAWAVPVHLMGMVYRSQYFASEVEAVRTIPQSGRTLSLIRASDVGLEVPGYAALCP